MTSTSNRDEAVGRVLDWAPTGLASLVTKLGAGLIVAGLAGIGIGFLAGGPGSGWVALMVATTLTIGLAVSGVVFSAIFQLTGARWGRAYSRLGEAMVALMPIGLAGIIVLIIGGNAYLPWAGDHHLVGGKAIWLTRGFWDLRIFLTLLIAYGISLLFLYYSWRRDFCLAPVSDRLRGRIPSLLGKEITDRGAEQARCEARLSLLAPVQLIAYAVTFSLLGFDLIMALEPDWFSTLFGAWYFTGLLFAGLALLAIISISLRRALRLQEVLTEPRQRDLATVLFAFCLLNIDFFWSQYLTIWYANMPEETVYLIPRTLDSELPWSSLSWIALCTFFVIPFVALIFRRIKQSSLLLGTVSTIVIIGVFLARFIEIAPPLLNLQKPAILGDIAVPLAAAALVFLGMLGGGLLLYQRILTQVPIMPVGDELFLSDLCGDEEGQP